MLEQAGRDGPADKFVLRVGGLEVHGLPGRPGLDLVRLEREADILARGPGGDGEAGQPAGVSAPLGLGHKRAWRGVDAGVELTELAAADPGSMLLRLWL